MPNYDHAGCPRMATHAPKIMVPATGWAIDQHNPLAAMMGLKLCEEHAKDFPSRDLFFEPETRELWREIFSMMVQAIGSQCAPDFDRAFTRAVSLDSEEWKSFEAAAGHGNGQPSKGDA